VLNFDWHRVQHRPACFGGEICTVDRRTKNLREDCEQSGRQVLRAFCGDCGSPIYRHSVLDPSILRIGVGSIKQRKAFTPVRQIWKCSALPWVNSIANLQTFERNAENINLRGN
jgi:hypothetical protein